MKIILFALCLLSQNAFAQEAPTFQDTKYRDPRFPSTRKESSSAVITRIHGDAEHFLSIKYHPDRVTNIAEVPLAIRATADSLLAEHIGNALFAQFEFYKYIHIDKEKAQRLDPNGPAMIVLPYTPTYVMYYKYKFPEKFGIELLSLRIRLDENLKLKDDIEFPNCGSKPEGCNFVHANAAIEYAKKAAMPDSSGPLRVTLEYNRHKKLLLWDIQTYIARKPSSNEMIESAEKNKQAGITEVLTDVLDGFSYKIDATTGELACIEKLDIDVYHSPKKTKKPTGQ